MTTFKPGPETSRAFRDALGQFATGVTVVTTMTRDGPIGITANSFASVSLEPPLVLWSPAKASSRYKYFENARHFAIHVLSCGQDRIAAGFARQWAAFDGLDVTRGVEETPLIEGCLARFECELEVAYDAGDHLIVVGRVFRAMMGAGDPLIFSSGRYGCFAQADD
ncbi:MAG: flavin reductase family protein [Pseudomonadota bacterium]